MEMIKKNLILNEETKILSFNQNFIQKVPKYYPISLLMRCLIKNLNHHRILLIAVAYAYLRFLQVLSKQQKRYHQDLLGSTARKLS